MKLPRTKTPKENAENVVTNDNVAPKRGRGRPRKVDNEQSREESKRLKTIVLQGSEPLKDTLDKLDFDNIDSVKNLIHCIDDAKTREELEEVLDGLVSHPQVNDMFNGVKEEAEGKPTMKKRSILENAIRKGSENAKASVDDLPFYKQALWYWRNWWYGEITTSTFTVSVTLTRLKEGGFCLNVAQNMNLPYGGRHKERKLANFVTHQLAKGTESRLEDALELASEIFDFKDDDKIKRRETMK